MAVLALVLLVAWLALLAVARGYLHYRRTGKVARPPAVARLSPPWWARLASTIGVVLAFSAPVAELLGLDAFAAADIAIVRWGGFAIAIAGIAGAFWAQEWMGSNWRPDVDPEASTELVTTGPFAIVRNPILACVAATIVGLALMVPNVLSFLSAVAVVIGLQLQVRLVEEPSLERLHGDAYRRYRARTGRFIPLVGRD